MSDVQLRVAENIDHDFSEQQGEFALALSKVQGEIQNPKKTSDNPYFKSKYADLAECIDASRPLLSKNEIAVLQLTIVRGDRAGCITRLIHSSGQWVQCTTLLKPSKDDPQAMGSCFTYARRYALQGLLGIAGEDDDGNAASTPQGKAEDKRPRPKKSETKEQYSQPYKDIIQKPFADMAKSEDFLAAWPGGIDELRNWVIANKVANITAWWQVATSESPDVLKELSNKMLLETARRAEEAKVTT